VDLRPGRPAASINPSPADPEIARALCDRNFGVGGDGVLVILPGDRGDARMRVINADGSEAEMCGNGLRCVAKVLHYSDPDLHRPTLRIDTGAGLLECKVEEIEGPRAAVTVQMGRPQLDPPKIPVAAPAGAPLVKRPLEALDRDFAFTAVSMGNPHAVIFVDDISANLHALAAKYGPAIEHDSLFPRRTNVEFARVRTGESGPEIDLVVWERGCGITLACGTGACATVVAACLEGRAASDQELPVNLPGGQLRIRVASETGGGYAGVSMRGPANIVFQAEIDPARIKRPQGR
jgi:diaminopimelate epimerase